MKASELVSKVSELIAKHGDLEIFYECGAVLDELGTIEVRSEPYLGRPILVIFPSSSSLDSNDSDIHAPHH
jgi:hypothetical protein